MFSISIAVCINIYLNLTFLNSNKHVRLQNNWDKKIETSREYIIKQISHTNIKLAGKFLTRIMLIWQRGNNLILFKG